MTTSDELFIPAKTLSYGTYQLTLTVSMVAAPELTSSVSAYVKIIATNISANLLAYGTSMITLGYQEDLFLDPGIYSVDPDSTVFNATVSFFFLTRIITDYCSSAGNRTGITNITVASMVNMSFPMLEGYC